MQSDKIIKQTLSKFSIQLTKKFTINKNQIDEIIELFYQEHWKQSKCIKKKSNEQIEDEIYDEYFSDYEDCENINDFNVKLAIKDLLNFIAIQIQSNKIKSIEKIDKKTAYKYIIQDFKQYKKIKFLEYYKKIFNVKMLLYSFINNNYVKIKN